MLVSILRSIAFQGPCSRNLNLRQSQICIVGIYGHRLSNGAFFFSRVQTFSKTFSNVQTHENFKLNSWFEFYVLLHFKAL